MLQLRTVRVVETRTFFLIYAHPRRPKGLQLELDTRLEKGEIYARNDPDRNLGASARRSIAQVAA